MYLSGSKCVSKFSELKVFVDRLSYDCHLVNDRDVSSAYCRCSSDDSVVLFVPPWSVVSDWCISDYFTGKYQLVINVTCDDLTRSENIEGLRFR